MGTPSTGTGVSPRGTQSPPRIFNVVVVATICQWVGLVGENEAVPDSFEHTVAKKLELFYTYDTLIEYTN